MELKNKLHEGICEAAGWPAYCNFCGGYMVRRKGMSYCPEKGLC